MCEETEKRLKMHKDSTTERIEALADKAREMKKDIEELQNKQKSEQEAALKKRQMAAANSNPRKMLEQ